MSSPLNVRPGETEALGPTQSDELHEPPAVVGAVLFLEQPRGSRRAYLAQHLRDLSPGVLATEEHLTDSKGERSR